MPTFPRGAVLWLTRALALFTLWTAVGLVFALPRFSDAPDWHGPLRASLAEWWSWGLMTPVIIVLNDRLPVAGKRWFVRPAWQAALGVGATILYVYVNIVLTAWVQGTPVPDLASARLLLDALRGIFLWAMIVYILIATAWAAVRSRRRAQAAELSVERLERRYAEARLNVLRLQLDPHFLFNALNTISAQLETEPKLARRMIEHLGDLLRLSLEPGSRHEVPLLEELAFLDHYLAIQRIRFGDRLEVRLEIASDVGQAMVPSLIMQPLVENAIRHGISRRAGGGTVVVSALRVGRLLEIRVSDDGVGLRPGWSLERDAGLGLSATRERIPGLRAGGGGRFEVRVRPQGGTTIEIAFPFRIQESCLVPADA
jgi:two-component system LytT family sensor kinase